MSYNVGSQFDGQRWYDAMIDARTQAELRKRRAEYEAEHRSDSDEELLALLRKRAGELKGIVHPAEFLGRSLIIERFGTWEKALIAAGLRIPIGGKKLRYTKLYREEYARQQKLHRAEREAKRTARRQRTARQDKKPPEAKDPAGE